MDHLFDMVTIMRWFLSRSAVNTKYIIYQFQGQLETVETENGNGKLKLKTETEN